MLDDVIIGDYAEFHTEETHDDLFGGYSVTIDKFISDRVLSKIDEFNQKALLNSSPKKPYKQIVISEEGLELIARANGTPTAKSKLIKTVLLS